MIHVVLVPCELILHNSVHDPSRTGSPILQSPAPSRTDLVVLIVRFAECVILSQCPGLAGHEQDACDM